MDIESTDVIHCFFFQIFFLSGVAILLGWQSTLQLFTQKRNFKVILIYYPKCFLNSSFILFLSFKLFRLCTVCMLWCFHYSMWYLISFWTPCKLIHSDAFVALYREIPLCDLHFLLSPCISMLDFSVSFSLILCLFLGPLKVLVDNLFFLRMERAWKNRPASKLP